MPIWSRAGVLSVALAVSGLAGCGVKVDASPVEEAADGGDATQPFSQVLTIDQISVYQGVKVTLVDGAEPMTPTAPIIPGRPALVRAATKAPIGSKLAKLTAELRVRAPGKPDVVVLSGPRTPKPLVEGDLASTFSWELTADQVVEGAALSIQIRDDSGADPNVVRYPAEGDLALNVDAFAPKLRVKFLPIKYEADASNRIPSMEPRIIEAYKDALYRMYPVASVEITVRDVLAWPLEVYSDGTGWGELLDAVIETRDDDKAADDLYYVGVFTPAESQRQYCQQGGCVLGVAPAVNALGGRSSRSALIVGYHSERQHGTLAQEIAHSMGRLHAPCGGPTAIDTKYPYADASIGTWGWDVVEKTFLDPEERHDFMSYCSPIWVSDYTYASIHREMKMVAEGKSAGFGGRPSSLSASKAGALPSISDPRGALFVTAGDIP